MCTGLDTVVAHEQSILKLPAAYAAVPSPIVPDELYAIAAPAVLLELVYLGILVVAE